MVVRNAGVPTYAPTQFVDVLEAPPTRPFLEIATINVPGEPGAARTQVLAQIRTQAALLGADAVIDYHAQDFSSVAKDMDVVFDTIGGDVQEKSWGVLKPGGMLVSITAQPSEDRAKAEGKRAGYVFIGPNAAILKDLAGMVDLGQVRPLIAAEFGMNDTAKAQDLSETGRATGKIVIYAGHP